MSDPSEKILLSERRLETETIIRWDRTTDPVTVCTCHQAEWRMLDKAGYKATEVGYDGNNIACKTYEISRHHVKVALMPSAKIRPHPSFRVSQRGSQKSKVAFWTEKYKHQDKNERGKQYRGQERG